MDVYVGKADQCLGYRQASGVQRYQSLVQLGVSDVREANVTRK